MKARFVSCLLPLLVAAACAAETPLPEGKGKDIVETTCTECHSLERIKAQRLSDEGWEGIIREMMESGASINPDDVKVIVDYLAKNFGPDKKVNVNEAAASEIGAVLRLTPKEADAIVQYRARNGKFKDFNELEKASGAAEKIEAKKALIEF
jgi:competence ComEA-like helix-hairpin-helix protein